ncbi:DUF5063 domain-containing protein [Luteimonas sp. SX5]|uniref:DUF5063 domain-containing protein n=1 Tax=Luteimonas galliterrae TaxID=2940486 RepID=A0ABT0MKU2_9GAMM|nr:DUF5063 domain-containing protein [Luteimonas galliterrae]MCL1635480.1 DUF5063 domain-containing protein [Luteimonas galliterrae]
MSSQVQHFAEAANQFCSWAEHAPQSPEAEAGTALRLLSSLYQQALTLPDTFAEGEPAETTDEEWKSIYRRFGALPFNYYSQRFDPMDVQNDALELGDLADDLADTWRDLRRGLSLFKSGHVAAAGWEWRQSFWQHWGHHAAGGIYALHCWLAEHSQGAA